MFYVALTAVTSYVVLNGCPTPVLYGLLAMSAAALGVLMWPKP